MFFLLLRYLLQIRSIVHVLIRLFHSAMTSRMLMTSFGDVYMDNISFSMSQQFRKQQ